MAITITYKESAKGWVSFKSFIKEQGISLNNKYYTFSNGMPWEHHVKDLNIEANSFYGQSPVDSYVDVIFNQSANVIKDFKAIAYEGSQSRVLGNANNYYDIKQKQGWWVESMITDEGYPNEQTGSIPEFIEKEGKWFNYIKGEQTYWNSVSNNNLNTSEFNFQGIGNAVLLDHSLPPLSTQLFSVIDSSDLDTNNFPGESYVNPLNYGQMSYYLTGLININAPYINLDAYEQHLFNNTSNMQYYDYQGNDGYNSYSNVNAILSQDNVSGFQTISLWQNFTNIPGVSTIEAHKLRINGHSLSDTSNTFITNNGVLTPYGALTSTGLSTYTGYTIQDPSGGYVDTYSFSSSNVDVNITKIEITEDHANTLGLSVPGSNYNPRTIIKVYFESFTMPAENIIIPIDIDHDPPGPPPQMRQLQVLFKNDGNGFNSTMAPSQPAGGTSQYYTSRSSHNFNVTGGVSSGVFNTKTLQKAEGSLVQDIVTFKITPTDTYVIGDNGTTGNVYANAWGKACDNLTIQSLRAFSQVIENGVSQTISPYAYTGTAPNVMASWLTPQTVETEHEISISGNANIAALMANNPVLNAFWNSYDKINKIVFKEVYANNPPANGEFPIEIIVDIHLSFVMPTADVQVSVDISMDTQKQISSLPTYPWQFGCATPGATNPTTFLSGYTPVDDGSCTLPPPFYNLNIWLVNNINEFAIDVSGDGQPVNTSLYTPPDVWDNSNFYSLFLGPSANGARFELPQSGVLNMSSPDATFSIQQGSSLSGTFIANISRGSFPIASFSQLNSPGATSTLLYPLGQATDNINLSTLTVNGVSVNYGTYGNSLGVLHWAQNSQISQYKDAATSPNGKVLNLYAQYGTNITDIGPQGVYSGFSKPFIDNVQPSYMIQSGSNYDNRVTETTTFSNGYGYISHVIGTENQSSSSIWLDSIDLEFHLDNNTLMPGNDVNIFIDISQNTFTLLTD